MAISTKLSKQYTWRMLFLGVLCFIFGVWGMYDLWVKLPRQEARFQRYQEITVELQELTDKQRDLESKGLGLTSQERQRYEELERTANAEFTDGAPTNPSKFDKLTQWFFILCLPCAPYFLWLYGREKKRVYTLEDDGTLCLPGGDWSKDDLADIDMSRWMAKSVAFVVHTDGTRVKLDDYIHKGLHLIVGRLASERYPDEWTEDARPVKTAEASSAEASADDEAGDETGRKEPVATGEEA